MKYTGVALANQAIHDKGNFWLNVIRGPDTDRINAS